VDALQQVDRHPVCKPPAQGRTAGLRRCRPQATPWRPSRRNRRKLASTRTVSAGGCSGLGSLGSWQRSVTVAIRSKILMSNAIPLPVAKGQRWGWAWRSGLSGHLNLRSMWKPPFMPSRYRLATDREYRPDGTTGLRRLGSTWAKPADCHSSTAAMRDPRLPAAKSTT
jgi:hypothetical protein